MVAVVAALASGSQKEAIVQATASATNQVRGRGAYRWHAAAAMVPKAPPSNSVASTKVHRHALEVVAEHLGQLQGHVGKPGNHVQDGVGGGSDQPGGEADLQERPLGPG